jgi:endonuclease/exonuclease/phosphatase family metal-dependent hydrolase
MLARGTKVHIYNVHADAGRTAEDWRARALEFVQLANYIRNHSRGEAVVVAGDTNLNDGFGDRVILQDFLGATGLVNTCAELNCGHETLDKVFVRSSDAIELTPLLWRWDSRFVDRHGRPLSDHPALRVDVGWRNLQ